MRILVTDDNQVARKILVNFLNRYGKVQEASSGLEAVAAFTGAFPGPQKYDLVFLDINMPEMSGQQALTEIRSFEKMQGCEKDSMTKIVMITSLGDKKTVHEAISRQASGFLLKPVTRQILETELKRLKMFP